MSCIHLQNPSHRSKFSSPCFTRNKTHKHMHHLFHRRSSETDCFMLSCNTNCFSGTIMAAIEAHSVCHNRHLLFIGDSARNAMSSFTPLPFCGSELLCCSRSTHSIHPSQVRSLLLSDSVLIGPMSFHHSWAQLLNRVSAAT